VQVVIKSQILAGGRGLGSFTNGLKGGVHIAKATEAAELAKKMLGGTLVTKQTGAAGKPVNVLWVAALGSHAASACSSQPVARPAAPSWRPCPVRPPGVLPPGARPWPWPWPWS
jgi:hypothetical protein